MGTPERDVIVLGITILCIIIAVTCFASLYIQRKHGS